MAYTKAQGGRDYGLVPAKIFLCDDKFPRGFCIAGSRRCQEIPAVENVSRGREYSVYPFAAGFFGFVLLSNAVFVVLPMPVFAAMSPRPVFCRARATSRTLRAVLQFSVIL